MRAPASVDDVRDLPGYLQAIEQLAQPLHFGDYGGVTLKIFWVALFLGLALFITGNGAWLWWNRRRQPYRNARSRSRRRERNQ